MPLGESGTVYPTLTLTDQWGVLKVTGGALISSDFQQVVVGVPPEYAKQATTTEWQLELQDDWKISQHDDRAYRVVPAEDNDN